VFLLTKAGEVKLLTDKIAFPNGIALSPDEKILYVAESGPDTKIHAFNIQADGTIDEGRVFFNPAALKAAGQRGGCDGLKIDEKGNLFATGPGGVLVITPNGRHLGTISTGTRIANVGWGDDGRTLYLTADNLLCRIRTLTKGAGFGFEK
jgi:gluconolactonase